MQSPNAWLRLASAWLAVAVDESDEPSSRLYMIGTGVRTDGTRVIGMVIKSR
jgi:hypothetical protein